ncbi:hypothetical protein BH09BAC1_BH09BAC1_02650 [soil metagenome]
MGVLADEQIKEIAEDLQSDMLVFWNPATGELLTVPDESKFGVVDEELWTEQLEKLENNPLDYKRFEAMQPKEAFQVMADFIDTLAEKHPLKRQLKDALGKPKPFAKFKWIIEGAGREKQEWFTFRKLQWIDYVTKCYHSIIEQEAGQ